MAGNDVRVVIGAKDEFTPTMTKISGLATAGFLGMGAAAIKMAADFEHSLDQVGAVAGATADEMEGLRAKALQIGADTSKSASEAADAMGILAANGLTATEIMGGAAEAAVALAEAGGTTLATAADTASTALTVWGLSASDLKGVVNELAGAANVSKFGVEDMSAAIAQGGGVAAAAGVDFLDFSTAIAATSSSFSSGSDAGTSFKTFLTALANPTKESAKAMADLGFSAYDAAGNLKPMSEIVQNLHNALGPLTEQQRAQAAATIFGSDAMRTALGLAKLTGDEFVAMGQKLETTNAADIAKQRMDNLSGGVEALKGSLETIAITIGSKAIPMLSNLAGGATTAVNAFGEMDSSTQNLVIGFTGLVAAMPLVVNTGAKVADMFERMHAGTATLGTKVGALTLGLGALSVGADVLLQKSTGHGLIETLFGDPQRADAIADALGRVAFSMKELKQSLPDALSTEVARLGDAFRQTGVDADKSLTVLSQFDSRTASVTDGLHGVISVLQENNAGFADYQRVLESLPPALQGLFREWSNFDKMSAELAASQQASNATLLESAVNIDAIATATSSAVTQTHEVKSAGEAWLDTLADEAGKIGDVDQALQTLLSSMGGQNLQLIDLTAQNASLNIEIGKLKAQGDALNATDAERLKNLEAQKTANDQLIGSIQQNQKANEDLAGAVQLLIGAGGLGALTAAMSAAKRPVEEQTGVLQTLAAAYHDIAAGRIPEAIAKLNDLKGTLTGPEWAAIGSDLPANIAAGIRGTASEVVGGLETVIGDALAAGRTLTGQASAIGTALGQGIASGLSGQASAIANTMASLVHNAIISGQAAANAHSPSKETEEKIGLPMAQGVAVGILAGAGIVSGAMTQIVVGGIAGGSETVGQLMGQMHWDGTQWLPGAVPTPGSVPPPLPPGMIPPITGPGVPGASPWQDWGTPDWAQPIPNQNAPAVGTVQSSPGGGLYQWNGSAWVPYGGSDSAQIGGGGDSLNSWGQNGLGTGFDIRNVLGPHLNTIPGFGGLAPSNLMGFLWERALANGEIRGFDTSNVRDQYDDFAHGGHIDSLGRFNPVGGRSVLGPPPGYKVGPGGSWVPLDYGSGGVSGTNGIMADGGGGTATIINNYTINVSPDYATSGKDLARTILDEIERRQE